MDKIAIIIPAYKKTYLADVFNSLIKQQLHDCSIYVFDDNSPYNVKDTVDEYKDILPLIYHRFEENLGGHDLTSHWNRCIDSIREAEWIWLFSDDDIMCEGCFEATYQAICTCNENFNILHINGDIVDNEMNRIQIKTSPYFPEYLTPAEYIERIISNRDNSWGINYIVRYKTIKNMGGFVGFDLAWNSDRASWLKFSTPYGIKTVPNAKVLWRYSGENITALKKDITIQRRKAFARVEFLKWLATFKQDSTIRTKPQIYDKICYLLRSFKTDYCIGKDSIIVLFLSAKYIFR